MAEHTDTLYQAATAEIGLCIEAYLTLMKATKSLSDVRPDVLVDERTRTILLAGRGVTTAVKFAEEACEEWRRRQAIPFDTQTAITAGVYRNIRAIGMKFLDDVERNTDGFRRFTPEFIAANPYVLPLLQHLSGVFSKAKLKELVGSVSDTGISKPASIRLAKLLSDRVQADRVNKGEILQRLESTLEGIVRDLVGRIVLESIVAAALNDAGVPFQREDEYESLKWVLYNFRADFVLPSADKPRAFIEVRKSSSRHASLYAKDKMFSAMELLAILVVDGEWTGEYIVPVGRSAELAQTAKASPFKVVFV